MNRKIMAWTFALAMALGVAAAQGAETDQTSSPGWPCWRGPTGDDHSELVPTTMPEAKLLWKQRLGGKCSAGVVAAEGRVVVADHDGNRKRDYYHCFDATTGKRLWTFGVANRAEFDYGSSPRATPCIRNGRVLVIGAVGDVHCLDLKTGKVVWEKDFRKDFGVTKPPTWGHSTAPLVVDDKLILLPGDAVALDVRTGKTLWRTPGAGANYSMLLAGTFGGVEQVIGVDAKNLCGWAVADGRRLWSLEVDNSKKYIVTSPVAVDGKLLVATESDDCRLFAFDDAGRLVAKPVAINEDLIPEMAVPTLANGLVLGTCEGLIGLDPAAGLKTAWISAKEKAFYGLGFVVAGKDRALVFGENGTMVLVAPSKSGCEILGKTRLCRTTWSHPALAYGNVYIRDEKTLYCYSLSAKPASP